MKTIAGMVILVLFLVTTAFESNEGNTGKISRKWRIDQLYLDSVKVLNNELDSLRYEFKPDGTALIGNIGNEANYVWQFSDNDKKLILRENNTSINETFDILFLSPYSLIIGISLADTISGENVMAEFRLLPENGQ